MLGNLFNGATDFFQSYIRNGISLGTQNDDKTALITSPSKPGLVIFSDVCCNPSKGPVLLLELHAIHSLPFYICRVTVEIKVGSELKTNVPVIFNFFSRIGDTFLMHFPSV